MRVLFVSSELYPLAKTGGLADVSGALPKALAHLGVDVRLMLPGYPQALDQVLEKRVEADLGNLLGTGRTRVITGRMPDTDLPVWLVDCPRLYRRAGGLYQDADGREWSDNGDRFALLCQVGARLARGITASQWRPDIIHANDWHTGLLPALLATTPGHRPATLFTIHNMSFQGNFPAETFPRFGIPEQIFGSDGAEFYGQVSFLKAGIRYSDLLTTVSPTYSQEILSPEFGHGMDGVLRERVNDLVGVLNGVDYEIWDPNCGPYLARPFSRDDLSGKKICKAELQNELGFEVDTGTPLIAFVSRLTEQKMADIVLEAMPWLLAQNVQFALLSEGDRNLERAFAEIAHARPEKAWVRIGYEEPLAHRLQSGADMLLAPARFEPCGLTHLYALRYGTLPIVRRTGGLADTVADAGRRKQSGKKGSGFVFQDSTATDMIASIEDALSLFQEPLAWRRVQLRAMGKNFGWSESAARYLSLYQKLALSEPAEMRVHEGGSVESTRDAWAAG